MPRPSQVGRAALSDRVSPELRDPFAEEPVDEAIPLIAEKGIKVIWMQLGVRNDEAADRAEAAGLKVVMNRCPKIEYGRLFGELSWSGVNTKIISAKRQRLRR